MFTKKKSGVFDRLFNGELIRLAMKKDKFWYVNICEERAGVSDFLYFEHLLGVK